MEKNRLRKIVNTANSRDFLGNTRTATKAIAPGVTLFTPQRWPTVLVDGCLDAESDDGPNNIDRSI
jgi:hypothetical protein